MGKWVNIAEVRERVTIFDVLEHYGMRAQLKPVGDRQYRGNCPLPVHSGDSKNSFTTTRLFSVL